MVYFTCDERYFFLGHDIYSVIGLVILIFVELIYLVKKFWEMKSIPGILISSILIYFLVLSNFLVILEFPYNAIPFWTLFGMGFAYYHQQLSLTGPSKK